MTTAVGIIWKYYTKDKPALLQKRNTVLNPLLEQEHRMACAKLPDIMQKYPSLGMPALNEANPSDQMNRLSSALSLARNELRSDTEWQSLNQEITASYTDYFTQKNELLGKVEVRLKKTLPNFVFQGLKMLRRTKDTLIEINDQRAGQALHLSLGADH